MAFSRAIWFFYSHLRRYRWLKLKDFLDYKKKNILEIGCEDLFFYNKLVKSGFKVLPMDLNPKKSIVRKENVEKLPFKDKSFEQVVCLEVVEHTLNPVKALNELRRVTKGTLIISVPYEPFFSLFRLFNWPKDHKWAVTPQILKHYLGKPSKSTFLFFKRYYLARWDF